MFDDLQIIYIVFQSLGNNIERVEYLQKLKERKLDYKINYDNLIKLYSN